MSAALNTIGMILLIALAPLIPLLVSRLYNKIVYGNTEGIDREHDSK